MKAGTDRADKLQAAAAAAATANRNYQLEAMKAQWAQQNALATQKQAATNSANTAANQSATNAGR